MKRALIQHQGRPQWVTSEDGETLRLPSGETIAAAEAFWLAPVEPGATVFALGLNYADHSAELGFKKQDAPLTFLKGFNTFVGHNGVSPRAKDANQMHPECELVAVIGKQARNVSQADALDHVSGYTVANDYAIREYLENYYRPNLRVKNRDATTPLGPFIVDAAEIGDTHALEMRTMVNGAEVQHGNTADMIFSIPFLIEYFSSFMTLMPGDLILTGTPHGVHFVQDGDEVVCEIEKVGRLVNHVRLEP